MYSSANVSKISQVLHQSFLIVSLIFTLLKVKHLVERLFSENVTSPDTDFRMGQKTFLSYLLHPFDHRKNLDACFVKIQLK